MLNYTHALFAKWLSKNKIQRVKQHWIFLHEVGTSCNAHMDNFKEVLHQETWCMSYLKIHLTPKPILIYLLTLLSPTWDFI